MAESGKVSSILCYQGIPLLDMFVPGLNFVTLTFKSQHFSPLTSYVRLAVGFELIFAFLQFFYSFHFLNAVSC